MNLRPDELEKNGYTLMDCLPHQDLAPFIRMYLNKRTKISVFYYTINILLLACGFLLFFLGFKKYQYSWDNMFSYFSYGLAIAFLLIPLHEYIHVLAYKSQGAKQTSYDVNLRKFYFMALADHFVADRNEFKIVALAPFIVITIILAGFLILLPGLWTFTVIGTLISHTAMCSGDFSLLNYFTYHSSKEIVTYDDIKNKKSYFFGRPV